MTDLSQMSMDELLQQQEAIKAAMEEKKADALKELQAELVTLDHKAQQLGSSVLELLGGSKGGKAPKAKAAPKYAHPENPSLTWAGRGARPKWLAEMLDAGAKIDDFLIKKD
mgnify:CR=1 FL=1